MKKILNPLRLVSNEFLNSLPIIEHNGQNFRKWEKDERYIFRYKGCQCFKDCDCHKDDGKMIGGINTYYRAVEFDGTDKAFHSQLK